MVNSAEVRTAFAEKTMSQAEAPLPQLGPGKAGSARDRALRGQEVRGRGRFPPIPAALRHLGKKHAPVPLLVYSSLKAGIGLSG